MVKLETMNLKSKECPIYIQGSMCSRINATTYPPLLTPRNPVRFRIALGKAVSISNIIKLDKPIQFYSLKEKEDYKNVGELMNSCESVVWGDLLDAVWNRQRRRADVYALPSYRVRVDDGKAPLEARIGLQSGGRSALWFHPSKRLVRIKGGSLSAIEGGDEEVPTGGNIEFYVNREFNNFQKIKERSDPALLPYEPVGWFDLGQLYNGNRVWSSIFTVKGDTRLDDVLFKIGWGWWYCKVFRINGKMKEFSELLFALGKMAGVRLRQLADTGIPWSRKKLLSNAHPGNMVLYEVGENTTLGVVDLDAAGGYLRSRSKVKDLIAFQFNFFKDEMVTPVLYSLAKDHKDYEKRFAYGPDPSPSEKGFLDGYKNGGGEFVSTKSIRNALSFSRNIEPMIDSFVTYYT